MMLKPEQVKVGAHVILLNFDHLVNGSELVYGDLFELNNAYKIERCHDDGGLFYIRDSDGELINFITREYKSFKLLEEPKHEETL